MPRTLLIFFSIILRHGCNLVEDYQTDTDVTCLIQSYIIPKLSKERFQRERILEPSALQSGSQNFPPASFVEIVTSRKTLSQGMDQTSQLMIGLLLFLIVAAVIGVSCALLYSEHLTKDEEFGEEYDEREHLQVDRGLHDSRRSEFRLNSSLVVPPRSATVYYLPDISQQRKPLESFSILDKSGKQALGVIVKEGDDDPGILLHGPLSAGGAGTPMAFIGTHPDAIRTRQLRIAWPSSEHPRGEMFGILELDRNVFKVVREGEVMFSGIEGESQGFTLFSGMPGSGERVGTTARAGDSLELRLQGGADAALAVLCVLVAVQLSASS